MDRRAAVEQQAMERWRHEVVGGLIQHGEADDLFTALMLSLAYVPVDTDRPSSGLPEPDELLRWAKSRSPRDPVLAWAALLNDRRHPGADTMRDEAALAELDPDNAYVALLSMNLAQARRDADAMRAALARAARAARFDDYYWTIGQRVTRALAGSTEAPGDALLAAEIADDPSDAPQTVRAFMADALTMTLATPGGVAILTMCTRTEDNPLDPSVEADCRAVAYRMLDPSASTTSARIGYVISTRLATDDAERATLEAASRRLDYLLDQHSGLERFPGKPGEVAERLARNSKAGSQLEAIEAELASHGIPTSPPDDWNTGKAQSQEATTIGTCSE